MMAHTQREESTILGPVRSGADSDLIVRNPANGEEIGRVLQHTVADLNLILAQAQAGAIIARALPRHRRAAILDGAAAQLIGRTDEFAALIVAEAGKTIRQARKEVSRAANTLALSAAEARRHAGEVVPFDAFEGSEHRTGWFTREPLGVIAAITPYNDALNLVAHKLGPAIAGGNSVIVKPAQQTPLTARLLVQLLHDSGLPREVVTVVHGDRYLAQAIVSTRSVRMVSFTGGFRTGEAIAASAGIKRLAMELGGNAPVLVFADADVSAAAEACASGAFWAAGQNCIGTQRILVHRDVYPEFRAHFLAKAAVLITGDPTQEATDVGPMISPNSAATAAAKVRAAVEAGATLLLGGTADGPFLPPTVLENVPHDAEVWAEEVFAPVVALESFSGYDEAIDLANRSEYALHAGVFTRDIGTALRASRDIDAGGVMINDSSDYRLDAMPFGGSKYGSMGREGVRFAYEEMTQPKVVCITQ